MSLPKPYVDTMILSIFSKVQMAVTATYLEIQELQSPNNRPVSFSSVLTPKQIRL